MIAWETFEADGLCGICGAAYGSQSCWLCASARNRTSDSTVEWVLAVVRRQIEIAEALRGPVHVDATEKAMGLRKRRRTKR